MESDLLFQWDLKGIPCLLGCCQGTETKLGYRVLVINIKMHIMKNRVSSF